MAHDLCSHMEVAWLACHLDGICLSRVTPCLAHVPAADFRLPAAGSGDPGVGPVCSLSLAVSSSELNSAKDANNPSRIICLALQTYSDHAGQTLQSECKTAY
jgi:hypothetical protein